MPSWLLLSTELQLEVSDGTRVMGSRVVFAAEHKRRAAAGGRRCFVSEFVFWFCWQEKTKMVYVVQKKREG